MSGRKRSKADESAQLSRVYEGAQKLDERLAGAGSSLKASEVAELFRDAQAEGMGPEEAVPELFDEEPRFSTSDDAKRLYSNLLGLWDRVVANEPIEPAGRVADRDRPLTPAPAAIEGPLTDEFVEAAWKHLGDLPPRESERWLHRFENTQPELTEALRLEAGEDAAVLDNADTLAFELWAMLELARPGRHRAASLGEFRSALGRPDSPEPAMERYLEEAVEEARVEAGLTEAQAQQVARIVRAVVRVLTRSG
jgi:hypothetical protein